jgi:hypothetical protein
MAVFAQAGTQTVQLTDAGLLLHCHSGYRYAVPLPSTLNAWFPLQDGLLLEIEARKKFHHSRVLMESPPPNVGFTYLTLTGHPYNDLYPLGFLDGSLWMDTCHHIVYADKHFPLVLSQESGQHTLYLLRVNQPYLTTEEAGLDSLDSSKRNEFYKKYVANEASLVTQALYTLPNSSASFTHTEVTAGTSPDGKV